jgi:hypothetical protein
VPPAFHDVLAAKATGFSESTVNTASAAAAQRARSVWGAVFRVIDFFIWEQFLGAEFLGFISAVRGTRAPG